MAIDALAWAERIFLVGPLVAFPLGLLLAQREAGQGGGALRAAIERLLWPLWALAALSVLAGFAIGHPEWRFRSTLPYIALAGLCLAYAAVRFFGRVFGRFSGPRRFDAAEFAIDYGFGCIAVGTLWLVVYQGNLVFRGFSGLWALLTANHFHMAGFGLMILLGAVGRIVAGQGALAAVHRVLVIALVIALPILALGIDGDRTLEIIGVTMYITFLAILAMIMLSLAVGRRDLGGPARVLFALSAGCVTVSMTLAAVWGLVRPPMVDIATMVVSHGALNAFGFVTLGLLGALGARAS